MEYPTIWPQFFTATILNWEPILKNDEYKDIIIECLQFLVKENKINLFGFEIMSNHIHLIWQPLKGYSLSQIQNSFLTFTANKLKLKLSQSDTLEKFRVKKYDRKYLLWKRESLSVELWSEAIFLQKLNYIHNNPVAAGLVVNSYDYKYSSAEFYETGIDGFNMLSNYKG